MCHRGSPKTKKKRERDRERESKEKKSIVLWKYIYKIKLVKYFVFKIHLNVSLYLDPEKV